MYPVFRDVPVQALQHIILFPGTTRDRFRRQHPDLAECIEMDPRYIAIRQAGQPVNAALDHVRHLFSCVRI